MAGSATRRTRRNRFEGAACPRCAKSLPPDARATGSHRCGACGLGFEVTAFAPLDDAPPTVAPILDTRTLCARHARNHASAACERCGAFMCDLCRIDCDGMALCSSCFERLEAEGSLPSVRRTFRNYNGLAFHVALYGALVFPLGWVIGPAAVWLGIKGRNANRRMGERVSVAAGVIGIVLGALDTVGGALFFAALLGAFKRASELP